MIASWLAKRMVRSVFDKAGAKGDAEGGLAGMAEDCVYDPGVEVPTGETLRGKKAVLEWYRKWYEQFPQRKLTLKNIAFAAWPLMPTNLWMVEWTCEETDKKGNVFKYDGTTVIEMKNGKGIRSTEFIACKGLPQLSTLMKPTGKA